MIANSKNNFDNFEPLVLVFPNLKLGTEKSFAFKVIYAIFNSMRRRGRASVFTV
jgi:hypothetical protein